MASTLTKLRRSSLSYIYGFSHAIPIPPPLDSIINRPTILPEHDNNYNNNNNNNNIGFMLPNSPFFGGSMELMAVPKKKDMLDHAGFPHKRGIRNGPRALKPVPVIIRCKVCGRVKLPHFFCCSGIKPGDENSSNS